MKSRKCPNCETVLFYKHFKGFYRARKKKSLCRTCTNKERWKSIDYKNKISKMTKLAWKNPITRKNLVDCQSRPEVKFSKKEKMVINCIGREGKPNFNKKACEYIDKLNLKNGWRLQHALNGKEVCLGGYFPDGYDEERNIIFEYDEPHHYFCDGILKKKDEKRQSDIIEYFKMKKLPFIFLRYDEKRDILYSVHL